MPCSGATSAASLWATIPTFKATPCCICRTTFLASWAITSPWIMPPLFMRVPSATGCRLAWGRPLQQQNAPRVPCNYLLHIHPGALRARSPGPTARRVGGPCWQHGFEGRALMSQSLVGRQRGIGTQAVVPSVGHFDHPLPAHLNEAPIHHGAGASPKAPLQARQRPAWLGRPS